MRPLVSVICISFNHAPYIEEALKSVFEQTYPNLEVIILDDGSSDDSQRVIQKVFNDREIVFIPHESNLGYTKTFNQGLALAKGEFIVDFALDDVMLPDFIQSGINRFEKEPASTGIVYSNADYIDSHSRLIGNHKELLLKKGMVSELPEGNIFEQVLKRYFICTPTMIIRKQVFDRLGGYDETLAYEDFDFWVRSSRYWQYAYIDEVQMQKRKLETSMSATRYRHHQNDQLSSVLKVCQKAMRLCKKRLEFKALEERLNYEYRQCLRNDAKELAQEYKDLLRLMGGRTNITSRLVKYLNQDFHR